MEAIMLKFSPNFIVEKLGKRLEKKEICSDILTEYEKDALSRLNERLGLGFSQKFRVTKHGLTLILEQLDYRKWQKADLHDCGVSALTLATICAKVFYGQDDRPRKLFNLIN